MCPPHQRFNLAQCKKYATESADQSLEAGRTCCQIVLIIGILFYHPGLEEMYCFWGVIKSIRLFFSESGSESDGESSSTDTIYLFICLLFALKLQGYSCV